MNKTLALIHGRLHQAANYRLRSLAGGYFRSSCRPVSISLLISERCNSRCVHCDIWMNKGKENSPTPEQWKNCLTEMARWLGPVQVTLTGGEALLRNFTPDLVAHGVSQGLLIELLTHGYWTDHSRLEAAALADPWRITMSLDGIGETHSIVRGRSHCWERSHASLQMLRQLRIDRKLHYKIRLKTVLMSYNIQSAADIAHFAAENDMEVFYQPIDQNYNRSEDSHWFETAPTWPKDPDIAVATVNELIRLKKAGYPIANSLAQLEVMIPYFRDPQSLQAAVQGQSAHEEQHNCAAVTTLQIQANGDVGVCASKPPIGNIKDNSLKGMWRSRPHYWETDCCQQKSTT